MNLNPINSISETFKSIFDFFKISKEKQLETFNLSNYKKLLKALEAAEQYILTNENEAGANKELLLKKHRKEFFKYNN